VLNVTNQKGLRSFGYNQGRYLIDAERSNESEHLVHHFHRLVHQAVRPALAAAAAL
jgi:choline monooxygenase